MKANVLCALAACILASAARADVTFTDRNVFYSAVSGLNPIQENWSELPDMSILTTYNGITYTPGTPGTQVITTSPLDPPNFFLCNSCLEGLGTTGTNGDFGPSETMTFDFSVPTDIFGIDINTFATTPDYTLTTNTGSTALSGYDPFIGYTTGQFVGLIASTPFTSVTITPAGNFLLDSYTLDNLTYNAVPEPGFFVLTAVLFSAILLIRKWGSRLLLPTRRLGLGPLALFCVVAALIAVAPGLLAQTPPPAPGAFIPPPQQLCSAPASVSGPMTISWPASPTEDDETPEGTPMCGEPPLNDSARVGLRLEAKVEGVDPRVTVAPPTIPTWSYSVRSSRDGNVYTGSIVGGAPAAGGTTFVPMEVIPVVWNFFTTAGVFTFDPTAPDPCSPTGPNTNTALGATLASPLFASKATWNFGGTVVGTNTTFPDAFQRANFWTAGGSAAGYHLRLSVGVPFKLIINAYGAFYVGFSPCGFAGVVDYATWDSFFRNVIYPVIYGHGVATNTFPLLLFYNVFLQAPLNPTGPCCVLGYHSAFGVQTYGITAYNTSGVFGVGAMDTAVATHELLEWVNDPYVNNATPAWGHIGQQSGCQNNYEVGDPLTGTLMPVVTTNGFSYHLQELAFFSWFFGGPSIGVNGWYSSNGTFLASAGGICH
jgi:hypothetical protein